MQSKEEIKEMAQTFREAADILDEIAELDDKEGMTREERKEKEEELSARFLLKMIKIQQALTAERGNSMNEIICDKCAATFTPDMIEIQNRVITQDEEHNDIIEQYYECPICGTHYTITITDRVQRIAIQKRRQLQTAVKNAIRARRPARAQTYKNKEKELADDIQARAKMLKEQYAEYTEE